MEGRIKVGNIYIFRGKAASGKSTLAYMLAKKLSIPVFCKDDIVDALKSSKNIDKGGINNEVCYNILYKIIQTNLDLQTDFILDIALADKNNAKRFFGRLDFKDNKVFKFLIDCSDEDEWKRRHKERLKNPLPHQSFISIEQVVDHYKKADICPFEDEYAIDNIKSIEESFEVISKIISSSLAL